MLNNPHLSYFLLRKKEERRSQKEERKTVVARKGSPKTSLKKHERSFKVHKILPSCSRNTPNQVNNLFTDLETFTFAKVCRIFRSFFVRKKFRHRRKEIFEGDTSKCSHTVHGITAPATPQISKSNVKRHLVGGYLIV